MQTLVATMLFALPAVQVLLVTVSDRFAQNRVRQFRRLVTSLVGFQAIVALTCGLGLATGWLETIHHSLIGDGQVVALTVRLDGVSALMFALVSFVGWVISTYSVRYLDGEPTQGKYFRWTAVTVGAVSIMVLSGNLAMFVVAWVMTSLALHKLLTHYKNRPAAMRAAWIKFVTSRLGDVALVAAIALTYASFQTLDLEQLFARVTSVDFVSSGSMRWAATCFVIAAILKSAQFPFHTWLPLTMETPTPVSALMHAGVVNAGGYLIVRTSPLIALSANSMAMLALIGGFTACFAAAVMLTQTSIKKKLAYSTIAQMGFMLLQCGLGSFTAAMLHILAHSLYKAHAFLSSGSVVAGTQSKPSSTRTPSPIHPATVFAFAVVQIGLLTTLLVLFGFNPIEKPGGLLLGGIVCLALTHWFTQLQRAGSEGQTATAFVMAGALCLMYAGSFAAVDAAISSQLPSSAEPASAWLVGALVAFGFLVIALLQVVAESSNKPKWMTSIYIHLSNGFYVESLVRRFRPAAS